MCRFQFQPVKLANVHIPLNVSSSHDESLAYGMENGKRNIEFEFFAPSRRHLHCNKHVFAVSELCDGPWSVVASSQRKLKISKSIEYAVRTSRTRQSTNWRLVYLLKVASKVQKRSTPSSSDDDHEHDDFVVGSSAWTVVAYDVRIHHWYANTCWNWSCFIPTLQEQREKPKITDLDVRINIEWVPFMPFESSAFFGRHAVYLSSWSASSAQRKRISQTVDCCSAAATLQGHCRSERVTLDYGSGSC